LALVRRRARDHRAAAARPCDHPLHRRHRGPDAASRASPGSISPSSAPASSCSPARRRASTPARPSRSPTLPRASPPCSRRRPGTPSRTRTWRDQAAAVAHQAGPTCARSPLHPPVAGFHAHQAGPIRASASRPHRPQPRREPAAAAELRAVALSSGGLDCFTFLGLRVVSVNLHCNFILLLCKFILTALSVD
jgi:hypothetical protein